MQGLIASQSLVFALLGLAPGILIAWGVSRGVSRIFSGSSRSTRSLKSDARRRLRALGRLAQPGTTDGPAVIGAIFIETSALRQCARLLPKSARTDFIDDLRLFETSRDGAGRLHAWDVLTRSWPALLRG